MATIINGMGKVGIRVSIGPSGGGGGASYLLDTYGGAAAAYSLRKLSSTYSGNAIRVRRSSDNTEQNIGFDGSGNLDEAALTAFVGAGNGFVTTWYDQSGNGRNQTQATAITQPRIVNSGTIEKIGTKPSINFISGTWMRNTSQLNVKSIFTLSKVDTFSSLQSLISFSVYTTGPWIRSIANFYWFTGNNDDYTYNVNGGAMYFNDHLHTTTDSILNQHILSSFGNTNSAFGFSDPWYGRYYLGKISEGIIYTTDERNGYRTGVVSNLNTYYSIY